MAANDDLQLVPLRLAKPKNIEAKKTALSTLTAALAAAPALTTLRTPLPALWAPAYAVVAANPALGRICLGDDLGSSASSSPSPSPCSSTCAVPACDPSTLAGKPAPPPRRSSFPSLSLGRKRPILPTALFLSSARRHARLSELVRAGTDIAAGGVGWRGRAATVGSC
ncbi:hypothetical protein B0H13DRAFT_2337122 [Mycena leptocephala]|nr:hypothetical protein B0H13DRAFT_2337122 [Mycena leptocephala]